MGYISKYNTTFICFANRKYKEYNVEFETWDDYALWLYYKLCKSRKMIYYRMLEKDLWDYSDWQTGSPRERERKNLTDNWKI